MGYSSRSKWDLLTVIVNNKNDDMSLLQFIATKEFRDAYDEWSWALYMEEDNVEDSLLLET